MLDLYIQKILLYYERQGLRRKPFVFTSTDRVNQAICGPRSLQIGLASYGISIDLDKLIRFSDHTVAHGTSTVGMIHAAARYTRPYGLSGWDIKDLQEVSGRFPVIVDYMKGSDPTDDGHYSLIESMTSTEIILMDPDCGLRTELKDTFIANWWDIEPTGVKVEKWAMVLLPFGCDEIGE